MSFRVSIHFLEHRGIKQLLLEKVCETVKWYSSLLQEALKEPNMNNPWCNQGSETPLCTISSEGAEYSNYGKNFSSGVIPYSRRSLLYSSSNDTFL
jgi:hypothetical protein